MIPSSAPTLIPPFQSLPGTSTYGIDILAIGATSLIVLVFGYLVWLLLHMDDGL